MTSTYPNSREFELDSSTVILTSGSPQAVRHVWKKVKNLRRSCLSTISVQSVTTDGVTVLQAAKEVCVVYRQKNPVC